MISHLSYLKSQALRSHRHPDMSEWHPWNLKRPTSKMVCGNYQSFEIMLYNPNTIRSTPLHMLQLCYLCPKLCAVFYSQKKGHIKSAKQLDTSNQQKHIFIYVHIFSYIFHDLFFLSSLGWAWPSTITPYPSWAASSTPIPAAPHGPSARPRSSRTRGASRPSATRRWTDNAWSRWRPFIDWWLKVEFWQVCWDFRFKNMCLFRNYI